MPAIERGFSHDVNAGVTGVPHRTRNVLVFVGS